MYIKNLFEKRLTRGYFYNKRLLPVLYCYEYNWWGERGTVDSSLLQVPIVRQYKIYYIQDVTFNSRP